jgi:hypothetical protein
VLRNEPETLVSGERPTRTVPSTVRKPLAALRLATGRGERTRAALRGAVAKWSARGQSFRSRVVAFQRCAPVQSLRIAWPPRGSSPECRWVGLVVPGRVYRDRRTRIATVTDRGNSHIVEAGMVPAENGTV